MVTNIDDNVGRLTEKLKALGIDRDTLLIFLVDNGPNTQRFVRWASRHERFRLRRRSRIAPMAALPGHLPSGSGYCNRRPLPSIYTPTIPLMLATSKNRREEWR